MSTEVYGGSGNDTFKMSAPRSALAGPVKIDGGGRNTLDYSGFLGDVAVDLRLGSATNVAGGIANIQNVVGSQGNDILVGTGGDVLTGGTGRNLLITGSTPSTLLGSSGASILVGGTTSYDSDLQALENIMAEWKRTDLPYAARVEHLLSGGGLNGTTLLNVAAFHSNGGSNTLTGDSSTTISSTALDLFHGLLPLDSSTQDKTELNPAQGEIFIDPNGQNVGVRIDTTRLSAPSVYLDGKVKISDSAAQWVTLQPGTHTLAPPAGYGGEVDFTVNNNDTINYASNLDGIFSGQGTNQLTVNGAVVTINATALSSSSLVLDYYTTKLTAAAFTVHLLPGLHLLSDATGSVTFAVNFDGTISFPASEDNLLVLQGSTGRIVKVL